jgi:hypothetical protein
MATSSKASNATLHDTKLLTSLIPPQQSLPPPSLPTVRGGTTITRGEEDEKVSRRGITEGEEGVRNAGNDVNFLEHYYSNSRLHHLSTWRSEFQDILTSELLLAISSANPFPQNLPALTLNTSSVPSISTSISKPKVLGVVNAIDLAFTLGSVRSIFHVDMDCFFASVAIRYNPSLYKKAVVVCHSNSPTGTATVSSASYEARKFGIKNGMMIGQAKSLCPTLEMVGYDFVKYEQISRQLYQILLKYTQDIQVGSCDEALLDVTSRLRDNPTLTPFSLAEAIRREIYDFTGCTASMYAVTFSLSLFSFLLSLCHLVGLEATFYWPSLRLGKRSPTGSFNSWQERRPTNF